MLQKSKSEPLETLLGSRIHVVGNSCSGKSTFGQQLASKLNIPFVELDALNWEPDWVGLNQTDPEKLVRRIIKSTAGNEWLVAGSYLFFCKQIFWPRLQTVIWLDLPMHLLIYRMITRSWVRWRSKELLWGTNYEKFWPQLMFWRKEESLLWWIVTQQKKRRDGLRQSMEDPNWNHIEFIHLKSRREIDEFLDSLVKEQTVQENKHQMR